MRSAKFLVLSAAAALVACSTLKEYPVEQRPLAAVMPFAYSAAQPEFASSAAGLGEALAGALLGTGRLRLLERQRVDALLGEAKLGATGAVDSATAARIGKQLGAQAVVLGDVVSVSVRDEGRSAVVATKTTRTADVVVEARLVDVETGELMASGRATGSASSAEKHLLGGTIGAISDPVALVHKAMQDVAEKLAKDLAKGVRPRKK